MYEEKNRKKGQNEMIDWLILTACQPVQGCLCVAFLESRLL